MDREALRQEFKKRRWSERKLSLAIGRGATYLNEYRVKGVPQKLEYDDAVRINRLTGIPLEWLGYEVSPETPMSRQATGLGYQADVEILGGADDWPVPPKESQTRCKVLTTSLNQHPIWPLRPGDLAIIDKTPEALDRLKTGAVVLAYLHDKDEERATPILREFIEPNLLITNTTDPAGASILNLADRSLPFDVLIVGKLTFTGRGNGQI